MRRILARPPRRDPGRPRLERLLAALDAERMPLAGLLGQRVRRRLREARLAPDRTAIVVVAEGSPRDGLPRATLAGLAEALARDLRTPVAHAFVDDVPAVEDLVLPAEATAVLALSCFLETERPETTDLPGRLARTAGSRRVLVDLPLGRLPELAPFLGHGTSPVVGR